MIEEWDSYQQSPVKPSMPPKSLTAVGVERALSELIERLVPGLDSGDIVADARTALAAATVHANVREFASAVQQRLNRVLRQNLDSTLAVDRDVLESAVDALSPVSGYVVGDRSPCCVNPFSSRVSVLGTKCCVLEHKTETKKAEQA